MPELPEVETVARGLRPRLVGRRFGACEVRWARTLGGTTAAAFARAVSGARVASVERRAKWIVLALARGKAPAGVLCVHLRMTGRLAVEARDVAPGPWERVRIALAGGRAHGKNGGEVLRFVDPRKFGRMKFARDAGEVLGELGPEPLGADFTESWLAGALRARRRMLKPLLLDQTFLAGLGNIYVDESLHRAGLHPRASSQRVRGAAVGLLRQSIRDVLAEAIEREGSSFDVFYRTPEGNPGQFQEQWRVYGRTGKPCRTCGEPIRYLVVGQRGTHVCVRCQPRRGRSVRKGGRAKSGE